MSHRAARAILIVGCFVALTLLMAYPLSWEPGHQVLDLGADTRLFVWTLSWDLHALSHHPLSLFNANIFYPEHRTLAYSEHLLGAALLAAPWMVRTTSPLLALNVVALLSCVGCGIGAYFLARRLGASPHAAFVSGVIFAFAPPRFFRLGQIHLATLQWTPLCLAFLHTWAKGGCRRHLLGAAVLFWLQALSGGQSGLFLLLASLGLLTYLLLLGRLRPRGRVLRDLTLSGTFTLLLNLPFLLPYLRVQQEVGLRRPLQEADQWSPNATSFLAAPTHAQRALLSIVPQWRRRIFRTARAYLFPGFVTLLLATAGVLRRRGGREPQAPPATVPLPRRPVATLDALLVLSAAAAVFIQAAGGVHWKIGPLELSARNGARGLIAFLVLLGLRWALARKAAFSFRAPLHRLREGIVGVLDNRMGVEAGFYVALVALSFWASLGPRFGLYAALYRLLPGFDFIRVPARLSLLSLLGLAVLAGLGAERLFARYRPRGRAVAVIIVSASLLAEYAAFPLDTRPYRVSIPGVDRWLNLRDERLAVAELPVADPRDALASARLHSLYMLYSTVHWHPLVNGYSGFTPPTHDSLFRKLVNFPDEASLQALEKLGVAYAVVHLPLYEERARRSLEGKIPLFADRLRLVYATEEGRVYELIRSRRSRAGRERE